MSLSLTKGLCILDFVSISVTSKVRWRNSLCFITKPQQYVTAYFYSKTNQMHKSQIYFILEQHSTCFRRSLRPLSKV